MSYFVQQEKVRRKLRQVRDVAFVDYCCKVTQNYSALYFVKHSTHGKMFQIRVVDIIPPLDPTDVSQFSD